MTFAFNPIQGELDLISDPAGTTGQIQYNNGGVFGGATVTYTNSYDPPGASLPNRNRVFFPDAETCDFGTGGLTGGLGCDALLYSDGTRLRCRVGTPTNLLVPTNPHIDFSYIDLITNLVYMPHLQFEVFGGLGSVMYIQDRNKLADSQIVVTDANYPTDLAFLQIYFDSTTNICDFNTQSAELSLNCDQDRIGFNVTAAISEGLDSDWPLRLQDTHAIRFGGTGSADYRAAINWTGSTLLLGGYGATNNEKLTLDFETTANKVGLGTTTGVTGLRFASTLNLELGGSTGMTLTAASSGSVSTLTFEGTSGLSPVVFIGTPSAQLSTSLTDAGFGVSNNTGAAIGFVEGTNGNLGVLAAAFNPGSNLLAGDTLGLIAGAGYCNNALELSGAFIFAAEANWTNSSTPTQCSVILAPAGTVGISAPVVPVIFYSAGGVGTGGVQINGNIGFFGATPVAKASAYTQTFSTASRTMNAYTSDPESSAYTGINNAQAGTPYAQVVDLNTLRTAYENLRAMTENLQQVVNALIDDHQAYNLA